MTLQQLRYAVAIERHGSFAAAAEALGITQPTLSAMLGKLEEELDIRIFERSSRKISVTPIGRQLLAQAQLILMETTRLREMVSESKDAVSGPFRLAVGPSIAPYILPDFIRIYLADYPNVKLTVEEMRPRAMTAALRHATIDAGIATAGQASKDIYEIPLYTEPFLVYLSPECLRKFPSFHPDDLENEQMWVMKEVQCLRQSAFSFCKARAGGHHIYEAGNIDTLIRIVDANGGYTIIPRMHLPMLTPAQAANVRPLEGDHLSARDISMYIRADYVRQRMLNTVARTLCRFIPPDMIDQRLANHGIRL